MPNSDSNLLRNARTLRRIWRRTQAPQPYKAYVLDYCEAQNRGRAIVRQPMFPSPTHCLRTVRV